MSFTTLIPAYKAEFLIELLTCIRRQSLKPERIIFSDDSPNNVFQRMLTSDPIKSKIADLPIEVIELVRASLRGEQILRASDAITPVRSLPHGHDAAVVGALRSCGLESMLASRPCRERSLAVAMIEIGRAHV